METVVVERRLQTALDVDDLRANRERMAGCMKAHNVRLLHSYVAPGGVRMICVYEAPDAESVRLALRAGGVLPFDEAWKATVLRPEDLD